MDTPTCKAIPIQSITSREVNGVIEYVLILQDKKGRREYFKFYYQNNKERYKKKKKERRQDRIEKHFRDERARLAKIQFAYCSFKFCPKPGGKFVANTGVTYTLDGRDMLFCTPNCQNGFIKYNEG